MASQNTEIAVFVDLIAKLGKTNLNDLETSLDKEGQAIVKLISERLTNPTKTAIANFDKALRLARENKDKELAKFDKEAEKWQKKLSEATAKGKGETAKLAQNKLDEIDRSRKEYASAYEAANNGLLTRLDRINQSTAVKLSQQGKAANKNMEILLSGGTVDFSKMKKSTKDKMLAIESILRNEQAEILKLTRSLRKGISVGTALDEHGNITSKVLSANLPGIISQAELRSKQLADVRRTISSGMMPGSVSKARVKEAEDTQKMVDKAREEGEKVKFRLWQGEQRQKARDAKEGEGFMAGVQRDTSRTQWHLYKGRVKEAEAAQALAASQAAFTSGSAAAAPKVSALLGQASLVKDREGMDRYAMSVSALVKELNKLARAGEKAGMAVDGINGMREQLGLKLAATRRSVADAQKEVGLMHQMAIGARGFLRYSLIYGAGFQALGAVTGGIKSLTQFEDALKELQVIAKATDQDMVGLKDSIESVAKGSKFTLDEITKATVVLAQAGVETKDMPATLKAVADFAMSTGSTLKVAADTITSAKNVFSDLSLTEVANQMQAAINTSKLTAENLQVIMSLGAQTAKSAGASMEQFLGVSSTLSNLGVKPQTIATGTRQLTLEVFSPDDTTVKYLRGRYRKLGEDLTNEEVKERMFAFRSAPNPYLAFLTELKRLGVAGEGRDEFRRVLDVRAENVLLPLIDNLDKVAEATSKISLSGNAAEGAAQRVETLSAALTKLGNTLLVLADKKLSGVGNLLMKITNGLADGIANLDKKLEASPLVKALLKGYTGAATLGTSTAIEGVIDRFSDKESKGKADQKNLLDQQSKLSSLQEQEEILNPANPKSMSAKMKEAGKQVGEFSGTLAKYFPGNEDKATELAASLGTYNLSNATEKDRNRDTAIAELSKLAVGGTLSASVVKKITDQAVAYAKAHADIKGIIDVTGRTAQDALLKPEAERTKSERAALELLERYKALSVPGAVGSPRQLGGAAKRLSVLGGMDYEAAQEATRAQKSETDKAMVAAFESQVLEDFANNRSLQGTGLSMKGMAEGGQKEELALMAQAIVNAQSSPNATAPLKQALSEALASIKTTYLPVATAESAKIATETARAKEVKALESKPQELGMSGESAKAILSGVDRELEFNKVKLAVAKGKHNVSEITKLVDEQIAILAAKNTAMRTVDELVSDKTKAQTDAEFALREQSLAAEKEKLLQENLGADKAKKLAKLQEQSANKVAKLNEAVVNAEQAYVKARDAAVAFETKKEEFKGSFEKARAEIKGQGAESNPQEAIQAELDALQKRQRRGDFAKGDEAASKIKDSIVSAVKGGNLSEFDASSLLSATEEEGKKALKHEGDKVSSDYQESVQHLQQKNMELKTASEQMADLKKQAEALASIKVAIDPVSLEQMRQALLTAASGKAPGWNPTGASASGGTSVSGGTAAASGPLEALGSKTPDMSGNYGKSTGAPVIQGQLNSPTVSGAEAVSQKIQELKKSGDWSSNLDYNYLDNARSLMPSGQRAASASQGLDKAQTNPFDGMAPFNLDANGLKISGVGNSGDLEAANRKLRLQHLASGSFNPKNPSAV